MDVKAIASLTVAVPIIAVSLCAATVPAAARKFRHQDAPGAKAAGQRTGRYAAIRPSSEFYPNEIEGGVSGNLPFNNQIRKMKDPLNANGAGR